MCRHNFAVVGDEVALGRAHGVCVRCARSPSTALTAGTLIPRLIAVFAKLVMAVFFSLLGMAAGYVVWGARIGSLTQSMNQMVLEEDTLRTRLAAVSSEDDKAVLASALAELAGQLRAHSARIAEQAEAIDRMSGAKGRVLTDELDACGDRAAKLEHDLEQCLFDKAVFKREAAEAEPPAVQRRTGSAPYERTVTYPGLVPSGTAPKGVVIERPDPADAAGSDGTGEKTEKAE